jgi:dolichyl-phosphate beta-glucosyltransferase
MNRWSFDIEALYLARRLGYSISEAPIHWSHRPGSKLRIGKDYFGTLRDLFVIRDLHKNVMPIVSSSNKSQAPRR